MGRSSNNSQLKPKYPRVPRQSINRRRRLPDVTSSEAQQRKDTFKIFPGHVDPSESSDDVEMMDDSDDSNGNSEVQEVNESEVDSQAEEIEESDEDTEDTEDDSDESEGEDVTSSHMSTRNTSNIHGVMIEKSDFEDLDKEVGGEVVGSSRKFKISEEAMSILQMESEKVMAEMFKASNAVAKVGKREKLKVRDIQTTRHIQEVLKKSSN